MLNDSVREELIGKISVAKPVNVEPKGNMMSQTKIKQSAEAAAPSANNDVAPKTETTEINAKHTNPTLVEFHNRNATIPEWRLQLQNVVRQRQERDTTPIVDAVAESTAAPVQLITSGANALKTETAPQTKFEPHKNPTLNSALERIKNSRRQFLEVEKTETEQPIPEPTPAKVNKSFPFYIAGKTDATAKPAEKNPPIGSFAKPKLAASLQTEKERLDTNKLPPIPAPIATNFESRAIVAETVTQESYEFLETKVVETEIKLEAKAEIKTVEVAQTEEEFDDCAPFSLRFNAGLFDLIIGSFTSLFLLSPFMLWGGDWLSFAGLLAFLATTAVVMFLYMTTAIGFFGRTFGMRMFSLDMVDIETEEYPTFHQAAVSSAVYLLSLALGGIGFLSILFNEDRRAVHDLVSGTVMVKE